MFEPGRGCRYHIASLGSNLLNHAAGLSGFGAGRHVSDFKERLVSHALYDTTCILCWEKAIVM